MTAYTEHSDDIFEPDAPILAATHSQARDNLVSVATGGVGAPRIRWLIDTWDESGAGNQTYELPDQYTGAQLFIKADDTGGLGVEVSSDGSTFSAVTEIYPDAVGGDGVAFVDFHNGDYAAQYANFSQATGTITGAATSITHVRFSNLGTGNIAVIIHWNGGAVQSA